MSIIFQLPSSLPKIVIIFAIIKKLVKSSNKFHACAPMQKFSTVYYFFSLPHPIFHIAIPPPGSIIQTPTWYLCMVCYPHHSMLHWFSSRYPSLQRPLQTLCAYHPDNPDCLPMLWRTGTKRKFFQITTNNFFLISHAA